MRKKSAPESNDSFVIVITHADGVSGELTGEGGKVIRYPTEDEANKAISKLYKDKRYSWNGASMKCEKH